MRDFIERRFGIIWGTSAAFPFGMTAAYAVYSPKGGDKVRLEVAAAGRAVWVDWGYR